MLQHLQRTRSVLLRTAARDNKFLALAQICGAELIVSSDDDLLALNPWNGISLILPKDYLARP